MAAYYYAAAINSVPDVDVEIGKRIPIGWHAFPVGPAGCQQNATITFSQDNF